jgi:hypothetical protein
MRSRFAGINKCRSIFKYLSISINWPKPTYKLNIDVAALRFYLASNLKYFEKVRKFLREKWKIWNSIFEASKINNTKSIGSRTLNTFKLFKEQTEYKICLLDMSINLLW